MEKAHIPKVVLIGGAPFTGKTTVACKLAANLGYSNLSTDDIGLGVGAVATRKYHPDLFSMAGYDYREYYVEHSLEELICHTVKAHRTLWPAIEAVIRAHASWGRPIVIEGWSLYPERVRELELPNLQAIWLIADEELLESRIRQEEEFYRGASDEEKMIRQYLKRSHWYSSRVRSEAQRLDMACIELRVDHSPDEVCEQCLYLFQQRK
jgi:2-phosphoglycerate kinase